MVLSLIGIKEIYVFVILGIAIAFGIFLMGNFVLYYLHAQYIEGSEALVNRFLAIITAELMVIRPIELIFRILKKSKSFLK